MASLALVSYCRGTADQWDASTMMTPYVTPVLTALVQGPLSSSLVAPKVRAMGAVACVAEACGAEGFTPQVYTSVMPGLLGCAQLPDVDVAGAAIQAATIIGQAVGRDLFHHDAHTVLGWILPLLSSSSDTSNYPMEQLLSACARIASVLEEDFVPHIGAVLPHLLQRAQEPPDVSLMVRTRRSSSSLDGSCRSLFGSHSRRGLVQFSAMQHRREINKDTRRPDATSCKWRTTVQKA